MRFVSVLAVCAALSSAAFAQVPDVTAPPRVQLQQGQDPSIVLPGVVTHSRHVAQLENGRLTGEGADFLRRLGSQAQFVLIGEEHGNARIADFAGAFWRDLSAAGYAYAAIEADPWATAAMERELRAGGVEAWTRFVDARGGAVAAAFYTWDSEARFAQTIVDTTRARRTPTFWGLDQVFIGAAPWLLRDIAANARDGEARRLAADLVVQSDAANDLSWFGQIDAAPLETLRARLNGHADRAFADLVEAMIVSSRIYHPFSGGGGESWLANMEREALMKQTFLAQYRAAERADGAMPRVMLKFGANHMFRGASSTHVQALGGFVSELANTTGGGGALAIYAACGPGASVGGYANPDVACDEGFNESWSFLADQVDPNGLTIFDLRVWKMRPRSWAHLPDDVRAVIDSYDLLVIAPNGPAAQFLPGIDRPAN